MKIDLDWIQKELDAGREVVVINQETLTEFNIKSIGSENGEVALYTTESNTKWIREGNFSLFAIKRPAPTFNDLIDVAVQAYKDGIADKLAIGYDGGIERVMLHVNGYANSYYQSSAIGNHINHINSLYTETFVIESEGDIDRVNADAVIVLSNGSELTEIVTKRKDSIEFSSLGVLYFYILKGATVTQKR